MPPGRDLGSLQTQAEQRKQDIIRTILLMNNTFSFNVKTSQKMEVIEFILAILFKFA